METVRGVADSDKNKKRPGVFIELGVNAGVLGALSHAPNFLTVFLNGVRAARSGLVHGP